MRTPDPVRPDLSRPPPVAVGRRRPRRGRPPRLPRPRRRPLPGTADRPRGGPDRPARDDRADRRRRGRGRAVPRRDPRLRRASRGCSPPRSSGSGRAPTRRPTSTTLIALDAEVRAALRAAAWPGPPDERPAPASSITIVLFFVILGGLVLVHELGHFVTARLASVRVLEFGIGFPPRAKILRAQGETLYTLNWLPIGGFVKLEGEDGDDADDPRSFVRAPPAGEADHPRRRRRDEPPHLVPDLHGDRVARDAVRRPSLLRGPAGFAGRGGRSQLGRRDPRASTAASSSSSATGQVLTELRPRRRQDRHPHDRACRRPRASRSPSRSDPGRDRCVEGRERRRPEGRRSGSAATRRRSRRASTGRTRPRPADGDRRRRERDGPLVRRDPRRARRPRRRLRDATRRRRRRSPGRSGSRPRSATSSSARASS